MPNEAERRTSSGNAETPLTGADEPQAIDVDLELFLQTRDRLAGR